MTKNTQYKQQKINDIAWRACDTFRGVVDPAQYKDYIPVTLFIKYISDVWNTHFDEYRKMYKGDLSRIKRRLKRERFVLPEVELAGDKFRATFDNLYQRRSSNNIGELINTTLEKIEEQNRSKLEGVFRNIDFNSEPNLGKTLDRNRRPIQLSRRCQRPRAQPNVGQWLSAHFKTIRARMPLDGDLHGDNQLQQSQGQCRYRKGIQNAQRRHCVAIRMAQSN